MDKYIGLQENRMMHSLEVARVMKELIMEMFPEDEILAKEMFALGILHDIGYEYAETKEEHARIGGKILKSSQYKYWEEVYYHGNSEAPYDSLALRMLNAADLQVDGDGNRVSVEERLREVRLKYGPESAVHLDFENLAKKLKLI